MAQAKCPLLVFCIVSHFQYTLRTGLVVFQDDCAEKAAKERRIQEGGHEDLPLLAHAGKYRESGE